MVPAFFPRQDLQKVLQPFLFLFSQTFFFLALVYSGHVYSLNHLLHRIDIFNIIVSKNASFKKDSIRTFHSLDNKMRKSERKALKKNVERKRGKTLLCKLREENAL